MGVKTVDQDRPAFEHALNTLHAEIANVGSHLALDAAARAEYAREIKAMSSKLRDDAMRGRISWANAAAQANETRNAVMEAMRMRSTPVGRAFAQNAKAKGLTLNQLIAAKVADAFGPHAQFATLPLQQKNTVYAAIVSSAGKSNPRVTHLMPQAKHAGRGLVILSLATSVYAIATSNDKVGAAKKEVVITGAGVGGGMAGGAVAGLACGPGAPVCVTVGAFVGGAVAAFGTSYVW